MTTPPPTPTESSLFERDEPVDEVVPQAPRAQLAQPGHQPSRQPPAARTLAKLAIATQGLLIVCGVFAVATIGVETFGIVAVTAYLDGQAAAIDLINAYDQTSLVVTILSALALFATGVVWVLWQYRAAKQVAGLTRRSPGWHVGSWFVPVVSLWFPLQNISDLWRTVGRARPAWQILWWLLWIVSNAIIQISTRIYTTAEALEQFRTAMWASLAGETLLLAAVPLAWLIVRGITQSILQRQSVSDGAGGLTTTHHSPGSARLPHASEGRMSSADRANKFGHTGEASPLTFRADLARALKGEATPTGRDGKPLIQPWSVGPGRIMGLVAASSGLAVAVIAPAFGIVLGLVGLVLSNTAWAHLRNARRPRAVPLVGQFISGGAVLVGIATLVLGAVLGL